MMFLYIILKILCILFNYIINIIIINNKYYNINKYYYYIYKNKYIFYIIFNFKKIYHSLNIYILFLNYLKILDDKNL